MLFNSWEFAVFFASVLLIYRRLGTRHQNVLLLVASYVFYGWWDWRFLSLIWISTIVDYLVALRLGRSETTRRRALLMISVVTNLGLLAFFKYFNFFIDSAAVLIESIGLSANLPTLRVILPVGISFYTFQTLGYTIDVYRGKAPPERDPVVFATYVAYFPQLVAGPIERAAHLLPQIRQPRRADNEQLASGALLILIGLTRKVAIADPLASIVDGAFANPAIWGSADLLLAVAAFALQIYCDFAGYTDIARGTSRMLGIELMENFNHPYFAADITTFWRRWHISLSTWLRDYLYIPLGGNRGTALFTLPQHHDHHAARRPVAWRLEDGVPVVIVRMPMRATAFRLRGQVDAEAELRLQSALATVRAAGVPSRLLDLPTGASVGLQDRHFLDERHLGTRGAEIFSRYLAAWAIETYELR